MLTYMEIKEVYLIDEGSELPMWPHSFTVEFNQRRFDLSARTKREAREWVRVLKIVIMMNKVGFSVAEKNPYFFEAQHKEAETQNDIEVSESALHEQPPH